MDNQTYDDLIKMVAKFRLEHNNLPTEQVDKILRRTFRVDQATLREINGVSDLIQSNE